MFKRYLAPFIAIALLVGILGALGGCNTLEGAGRDIEIGGKALKDEARERK